MADRGDRPGATRGRPLYVVEADDTSPTYRANGNPVDLLISYPRRGTWSRPIRATELRWCDFWRSGPVETGDGCICGSSAALLHASGSLSWAARRPLSDETHSPETIYGRNTRRYNMLGWSNGNAPKSSGQVGCQPRQFAYRDGGGSAFFELLFDGDERRVRRCSCGTLGCRQRTSTGSPAEKRMCVDRGRGWSVREASRPCRPVHPRAIRYDREDGGRSLSSSRR